MILRLALTLCVAACGGCNSAPGRPTPESQVLPPSKIVNFEALYRQNCAGCHAVKGEVGPAVALDDGVYLAIADNATIRRAIAEGVQGTAMPAFARSSGGTLTDQQIDALVTGIRARWIKPDFRGVPPPPYTAPKGDSKRGAQIYGAYCSSCHGAAGGGEARAGSIVDAAYLALVSDQYLRTIVIVGRPELGAPDWRGDVPGKPMSQEDVSDVVAWLSAQRSQNRNPLDSNGAKPETGGLP